MPTKKCRDGASGPGQTFCGSPLDGKDFKRTRIIATLGPASASEDGIRSLIQAGADCFRLNFSHSDGPGLQPMIDAIRRVESELGRFVPILADIQGPKLRIGDMPDGVRLTDGSAFTITSRDVPGSAEIVHSPYAELAKDISVGDRVLLADGNIELVAEKVQESDVVCRVVHGGPLTSRKGINLPDSHVSVSTLTEKDRRDLAYIANADVDLVAISFVRRASDVEEARSVLGQSKVQVMAKLERRESLENLNDILESSDGVMVARGDLGVEIEFERVPFLQKQILARAAVRGKWAIVATEMLRSMVTATRPTRAEVTDVANAVLDGADAVMLSEETATGQHPALAIEAMMRILRQADRADQPHRTHFDEDIMSFSAGAAGAAVSAAERLGARAIIALAGSSLTALLLSKWRPRIPILALNQSRPTLRRLSVLRGVVPVPIEDYAGMEEQIFIADALLIREGWASVGDTVIIVGSIPLGEARETNAIRFHKIRPYESRH